MAITECKKCGVAFDVDSQRCNEPDCIVTQRQRKIYNSKPADPIYTRFMSCKIRAAKRGLEFDLTFEFIIKTLKQPCSYCGVTEPMQLDRKDNEIGYTMVNVIPACKRCNTVKSMYLSYEQMMIVAEALGWKQSVTISSMLQ